MKNGIILGCFLGFLAMSFVCAQMALGQELPTLTGEETSKVLCPKCKEETIATKKGGGVHLEKRMLCPDCKGKGTALEPHVCKKCGEELFLCDVCKKVVAEAVEKPPFEQVKCPTCKEMVTATKLGGGVRLEKSMVCPSCKKEIGELGVFKCEKCGKEMISCPICKQYSGAVVSEAPTVEVNCPNCKEMVQATKLGGGVHLEKKMVCPNCEKEVENVDVHTCSKCGENMALCPLCKKPM